MVSTRGVRRGSDKAKHGAGKAKKKGSTPHAGKQSSSSAAPTAGAAQTKRPPPSSSDDDTDAAVPCTADEQFRITPASGRWWKPTYTSRSSAKAVKNKPKKGNTWDRRKNKEKLHRDVVTLQNELVEQKARHLQVRASIASYIIHRQPPHPSARIPPTRPLHSYACSPQHTTAHLLASCIAIVTAEVSPHSHPPLVLSNVCWYPSPRASPFQHCIEVHGGCVE